MSKNTEMNAPETTALQTSDFVNRDALALYRDIMGEDATGLSMALDRIRFAAGGTTILEVPGDGDEPEMVKTLSCVILHQHPAFAYYTDKYQGGNNPPDCGSFDGVNGQGNPGGNCKTCPYNKFGSGEGNAKSCKNRRMLYLLLPGQVLPMILNLPTGSLSEFANYLKHQISKGRRLNHIVTGISVKKASSKTGIDFSQAKFSFERMLNADECAIADAMTEQVKEYASNQNTSALTFEEEDGYVDAETGEIVEPLK